MSATLDTPRSRPCNDHDAVLLEGLFQLAVAGDTAGCEFRQIDEEVYSRLLLAYSP